MNNILIIYTFIDSKQSFGGIKTILESYIQHQELFHQHGLNLFFFNYKPELVGNLGKIGHVIYGFRQSRALKKYLSVNDVKAVHIHTSRDFLFMKDILLARMIHRCYGLPVMITVHVGAAETVFCKTKRVQKWITNLANKYVSKMLFLSESIRKDFVDMGFNKEKTGVLYNFHDLSPAPKEIRDEDINSSLRLLYVGAIHREKGILDLLYAIKRLKDENVHLDICGVVKDTSIKEEFERMVDELQSCVMIRGLVTGAEKTTLYEKADVLVLPSYHEGLPMVILEALKTSCAIISTKVGGTPELLDDKNAIWVDIQSPEQIVEAIKYLYYHKDALNDMKYQNGLLAENYSLNNHINNLCQIYNDIL